jgi:predicted regulator of Ras-like GTPase activity (Roadblock/LC7/MglB family)
MGAKPVVAPPDTSFIPKTRVPPDVVAVPLSEISEGWADPVRQEIALGEWDLALVMFPVSRLEAGMKVGRLNFTWGEIRLWLNPPIGSIPSPHVDVPVELPLKVIAPLFMAARRPTGQKKVEFDETIPDVFTGLKQTAAVRTIPPAPVPTGNTDVFGRPTAVPTPSVPSAPMAMPMPTPTPAVVSHAPRPDGLGAIFGQPLKSEWSPAEITQKVSELSGVAGSLLTMADGLLVAGQVPAPQKAETLAAFMPQIFSRLTQYGGEMQLGALGALTMSTADGPCAIYKAGRLYLGVVGRAGQNLPEAQLQRIASEIAKRNP